MRDNALWVAEYAGMRIARLDAPQFHAPAAVDACKNGGWLLVTRGDGSRFKNQGDCMQFVNTGK